MQTPCDDYRQVHLKVFCTMEKAGNPQAAEAKIPTCIDHPGLCIPSCECHEFRKLVITALRELRERVNVELQKVEGQRFPRLRTSRTKRRIGCLKEMVKEISGVENALEMKRTRIHSIQDRLGGWQRDQYEDGGFNIDELVRCLDGHLEYLTDEGLSRYGAESVAC